MAGFNIARIVMDGTNAAPGGVAAWMNPTGVPIVVAGFMTVVTAASGASADLDVGVAANATTLSNTLYDGLDVGSGTTPAAPSSRDTVDDEGSQGRRSRYMLASEWVTASVALGDATGLTGVLILVYFEAQ